MAYIDRFRVANELIAHLDAALDGIADPFIKSRYVGFAAVSVATVYELALKDIFLDFASRHHRLFATFVHGHFRRINGQISTDRILGDHLPLFGGRYVDCFKEDLEALELELLRHEKVSVKTSYSNLLTWRNKFVHEGDIPATATYEEVKNSYEYGCRLLHCLDRSMRR